MIQTQQNLEASSITPKRNKNALSELRQLQESQSSFQRCGDVEGRSQNVSRKEDLKYGSGPHHVEMELVLPDRRTDLPNLSLNLLLLDEMPHSVHTFSRNGFHRTFDGCSFILNALHVVKAAPLPYDGVLQRKHERFLQLGLKGFKE
jgi:hypothetical protein